MIPAVKLITVLFAIAATSGGLNAQACSTFDLASIKLNTSGTGGGYPELAPGSKRFIATNLLMVELIMFAYDVPPRQISSIPSAFSQERYDVSATCDRPVAKGQLPHLLQSLLEDRFHLSVHRESKEENVFALVRGKAGSRLHESSHQGEKPTLRQSGFSFTFTNADLSKLAGVLSQVTGRTVVDRTGLRGQYDFTLNYAPVPGAPDPERPNISTAVDGFPDSVFTALREQLGLNLEHQKSQVKFVVVDRLDRLIPN